MGSGVVQEDVPARSAAASEPRWQAAAAVVAGLALYVTLPERLTYGPNWLLPLLEVALLPPLLFAMDHHTPRESRWERILQLALSEESPVQRVSSIALIALINAANVASLVLLADNLLHGRINNGRQLIFASIQIWLTNVIVFALWYWQLDRGGPGARARESDVEPDFLFPQTVTPAAAPSGWTPSFVDYLYLAYTNATAFSPTDVQPLGRWAKTLMGIQAMASLLIAVLVFSRAVNILT